MSWAHRAPEVDFKDEEAVACYHAPMRVTLIANEGYHAAAFRYRL